jgi:lipopolysaccharide export system protein LptC
VPTRLNPQHCGTTKKHHIAALTAWRDHFDKLAETVVNRSENLAQLRGEDRQRAFNSARSHSGRVRFAKIVLPIVAVTAILVAGGYMWISRVVPGIGIELASSTIRDGKLVMSNPKMDGFTTRDRPYSVRAARAIQDLTGAGLINLERIEALVPMDGDVTARIEAPTGTFDSEGNKLDMTSAFSVRTSDGMRADLQSAAIDLTNGSLSTPDPVSIELRGITLTADRMEVTDNGAKLLFESRVKLVVQPEALDRTAKNTESDAAAGG